MDLTQFMPACLVRCVASFDPRRVNSTPPNGVRENLAKAKTLNSSRTEPPPPGTSVARSATSGLTFALANAGQRALLFLLLPVYTAVLSPSAYGRLGLLITVQAGAVLLLQAGMEASVTRQYFALDGNPNAQRRFIQSAWRFLLTAAPLAAAAAIAFVVLLAEPSAVFRPTEGALTLIAAASFVVATVVPLTVLRAQQRLRAYLVMTAVIGASSTLLTIALVVGGDLGVVGWFLAATLSNLLVFVTALRVIPWGRLDRFDRDGVRTALVLGLSLVPHALSLWALSLANRIVLAGLVSPAELGVFTLAANLAIPAMVVIQSMNQGFLPSYARAQHDEHYGAVREVASLQAQLVLAVGVAVAVGTPPIIGLLDDVYGPAVQIVPWLVLGVVFWGLYQLPMNVISMVFGRTQFVWLIGLGSAAIGIATLLYLVPRYGFSAAGPASAAGYLALLLLTLVYLRVLGKELPLNRGQFVVGVVIASGAYVVASFLPDFGWEAFIARSTLILAATFLLGAAAGLRLTHIRRFLSR